MNTCSGSNYSVSVDYRFDSQAGGQCAVEIVHSGGGGIIAGSGVGGTYAGV